MTIHLPEDLASPIQAAVLKGQFASEDELVAAAVRDYLRRKLAGLTGDPETEDADRSEREPSAQDLQRRLVEAGVLGEVRPPITDLSPYLHRQAVPIRGEPLSETVLRERR